LQCCVLRPVVLPVALVGGVTYCPAVSLLRSVVCELVALCGVSSCSVPCSDLCALLCDFVPARFLLSVCVHAPWHVRGSVRLRAGGVMRCCGTARLRAGGVFSVLSGLCSFSAL